MAADIPHVFYFYFQGDDSGVNDHYSLVSSRDQGDKLAHGVMTTIAFVNRPRAKIDPRRRLFSVRLSPECEQCGRVRSMAATRYIRKHRLLIRAVKSLYSPLRLRNQHVLNFHRFENRRSSHVIVVVVCVVRIGQLLLLVIDAGNAIGFIVGKLLMLVAEHRHTTDDRYEFHCFSFCLHGSALELSRNFEAS